MHMLVYMCIFVCKWEFVLCGMCALSMGPWRAPCRPAGRSICWGGLLLSGGRSAGPTTTPRHLLRPPLWPGRAAWQAQPGTDSSAQPNPQDTGKEVEGGEEGYRYREERRDGIGCGGGGNFRVGGERGADGKKQSKKNSSRPGTLPTAGRQTEEVSEWRVER